MKIAEGEEQKPADDEDIGSVEGGPVERIPMHIYEIADGAEANAIDNVWKGAANRSSQGRAFDR